MGGGSSDVNCNCEAEAKALKQGKNRGDTSHGPAVNTSSPAVTWKCAFIPKLRERYRYRYIHISIYIHTHTIRHVTLTYTPFFNLFFDWLSRGFKGEPCGLHGPNARGLQQGLSTTTQVSL